MAKRMMEEYPLVCPFCDEMAYAKPRARKRLLPDKIYSLKQCPMGHEFWAIEYVPENQAQVVDEIRQFSTEMKEWRNDVKQSKLVKDRLTKARKELQYQNKSNS